jgi:hypothetical protein
VLILRMQQGNDLRCRDVSILKSKSYLHVVNSGSQIFKSTKYLYLATGPYDTLQWCSVRLTKLLWD